MARSISAGRLYVGKGVAINRLNHSGDYVPHPLALKIPAITPHRVCVFLRINSDYSLSTNNRLSIVVEKELYLV
jgi:hypothetical protein